MQAGQTIAGKYRLNRVLGTGGMASVWSATNVFTDREFAIKFMLPQVARTPEAARRFLLEAKVSGRINHPNIIEVIDVGQAEDGSLFLVMELLTGKSLETAVRRQQPPMLVHEFLVVMRDVADALAAAHRSGVIHRDLKPTNVFLHTDRDGKTVAKVLDFGVSKVLEAGNDALTVVGTILGSPLYMSPEQAMGAEGIDGRTDIFAFGAMLFEALAGHRAYSGANLNALIVAIATTPPQSIDAAAPELPEPLRALVRECMVVDKAQRLASFDKVVERLDQMLLDLADSGTRLPLPIRKGDPTPEPPPVGQALRAPGSDSGHAHSSPGDPVSARHAIQLANPTGLSVSASIPQILRAHGARSSWPVVASLGGPRGALAAGAAVVVVVVALIMTTMRGSSPNGRATTIGVGAPPGAQPLSAVAPGASAPSTAPAAAASSAPAADDSSDTPVVSVDSLPVAARGGAHAKGNGRLTVAATPGTCTVSIDGVSRGVTPLPSMEIPAGLHRIECAPANGTPLSVKLVISEGAEAHYQFALPQ